MSKVELFYSEDTNMLRILHPSGKVEVLDLDSDSTRDTWAYSAFSGLTFHTARKGLVEIAELIGVIEES